MKMRLIHIIACFSVLMMAAASCEEKMEWGNIYVYMPQASILDGGVTHNYPVPLDNNPTTRNYSIDGSGKLLVTLGLYRSGLQALEAFSVEVYADAAASDAAAVAGGYTVIPDGYWSIPETVSVQDGQREAVFSLAVDIPKLQEDFPDLFDKTIVLAVGIRNPSRYQLNESLALTTVLIDCVKFFEVPPPPELVPGGQFNDEDKQYWHYADASNSYKEGEIFVIADGKLTIYADGLYDNLVGEYWVELNETLVPGKTYELTMEVTASGGGFNGEFNVGLAPEHSEDGYRYPIKNKVENGASLDYKDYFFASLGGWGATDPLASPFSGNLPEDAPYVAGFVSGSSTFVAGENQKYLCLQGCAWAGTIGIVTVDNISLKEVR